MGDDDGAIAAAATINEFLSTSPGWGTTLIRAHNFPPETHFYPRPPRGGRQGGNIMAEHIHWISIHVPRVGDDQTFYEVMDE